jgi:hypothetical protein
MPRGQKPKSCSKRPINSSKAQSLSPNNCVNQAAVRNLPNGGVGGQALSQHQPPSAQLPSKLHRKQEHLLGLKQADLLLTAALTVRIFRCQGHSGCQKGERKEIRLEKQKGKLKTEHKCPSSRNSSPTLPSSPGHPSDLAPSSVSSKLPAFLCPLDLAIFPSLIQPCVFHVWCTGMCAVVLMTYSSP